MYERRDFSSRVENGRQRWSTHPHTHTKKDQPKVIRVKSFRCVCWARAESLSFLNDIRFIG